MDFYQYVLNYITDSDYKDWNLLNCLKYLKEHLQFTSDSKQEILDAFTRAFKKVSESDTINSRTKNKAKKLRDSVRETFQRREITEFFENLDQEFNERHLERSLDKNSCELLIKSGNLQTLNLSSRYEEKASELKRKYDMEDKTTETYCQSRSYKLRSLKNKELDFKNTESSPLCKNKVVPPFDKSNISMVLAENEVLSGGSSNSITSDRSYLPPSDSSTSEGSTKMKKSYYLDYFVGPGEIEWEMKEDSIKWVVNETDISKICMAYRASVIQKCNSREFLNTDEELALNYIFLFQEENPEELREYFDDQLWQGVFSEIRTQYSYIAIPEHVFDLCGKVVKIASQQQDPRRCRTEIKNFLRNCKTDGEFEEIMHNILSSLVDSYQNSFVKNNQIEDTHCHNYVGSVIKPFFPEGRNTTMDWANRTSESSAQMKKQFDPILSGSKPDFTIRTTNPKKFVELMFAEIKPPNVRENLVNKDLVTLGKTMRASLDKSLEDDVDLVICGLHVIGYLGRCYIIDLCYDGIYRMILMGEFRFPEDPKTWGTLMGCFQVMATIQDLVNKGATKYQYVTRKGTNQVITTNLQKLKFKKMMFHCPVKVPYDKV